MIIDKVRDYVIDEEKEEELIRRIEEAQSVKLMDNNLMIRSIYQIPSLYDGNSWLRVRIGDVKKDKKVYISLTYKNMIHFSDRPNLEKSIEVRVDDYEAIIELLDASGFKKMSTQETLRTKYLMYHIDSSISFEISIDKWPQLDKKFVQLKPERIIAPEDWEEIELALNIQAEKVESDSVNKMYFAKFNRSSLEIPYIGFQRFEKERKYDSPSRLENSNMYHSLFLYITERCQLKCKHCFMGNRLMQCGTMTKKYALTVARIFKRLGTKEITIIGGEPTLHEEFVDIVKEITQIGFEKVIIDTNGIEISKILELNPKDIHHIKVSVDSAQKSFHDSIRGEGSFDKTITNIRKLTEHGFRVCLNCTLFKDNIDSILDMRSLCCNVGATMLNFHSFSAIGNGKELLDMVPEPRQFAEAYEKVKGNMTPIFTTFPLTWIKKSDLNMLKEYEYKGCMGLQLNRFSVFPDGDAFLCTISAEDEKPYMHISESGKIEIQEKSEYQTFINLCMSESKDKCPVEKYDEEYIPVCKCWKMKII